MTELPQFLEDVMVDPSLDPTPGEPGHAAPTVRTIGWSPKALIGAAAAIVVPLLLQGLVALVELLASNPSLFDGLPAPVQFTIATIVTGLGVLLAARKASPGNVILDRS